MTTPVLDPSEWISGHKIPVARWIDDGFNRLMGSSWWDVDAAADLVTHRLDQFQKLLEGPDPFIIIAVFSLITWAVQRSLKPVAIVALGLLFILNLGYWQQAMQSLTLISLACIICMGIGVPLGILAAHSQRFYAFVRPVLDLMQTLPSFAYLVPGVTFFGIGQAAGLFATVIFVLPAPIRLTYLGIKQTPASLVEAGKAFGATGPQLLWKVELPSARPQIIAGLNQTIMLSLSMVVIAAMVGSPGMGIPIMRALSAMQIGKGFEAGLAIVALAIVLDRMLPQAEKEQ